jgi:hypothetical protein
MRLVADLEGPPMGLPIKFPSETEVILEEVARSRASTPEERVRSYRGFLASAARIARQSPKAAWSAESAEEQEAIARSNILEFLGRHGY